MDQFKNIRNLKNRIPLYAFVGVKNCDYSNIIDFVAHLETVITKQNKKFGLRTGLNYAQRSTVYLTREIRIALFDENSSVNLGSGTNDPFYEERAQLNSNPIKYHFLEIPVFLDFKMSKKWSIHGGLSSKFLFYSSTQSFGLLNGLSLNRNNDIASVPEFSENLPEGDFNVSYFEPRKFNLGASLGFHFLATERLGLKARFSQNLFDVYPSLPEAQRSTSVELGMSWRLR